MTTDTVCSGDSNPQKNTTNSPFSHKCLQQPSTSETFFAIKIYDKSKMQNDTEKLQKIQEEINIM
jgi:hypothetical protein